MSQVESNEEDLTRKQRREQARAQRRAVEEAEASAAARRTRLAQLGVVAGIAVVAIVVILIATSGGGGGGKVKHGVQKTSLVSKVEGEVGGIPQSGNTIGAPAAPVTMQYFGDLECPICREFTLGALPSIIQKWVRAGKLRIEYRSLETATHEPEVFQLQQVAALAAGRRTR